MSSYQCGTFAQTAERPPMEWVQALQEEVRASLLREVGDAEKAGALIERLDVDRRLELKMADVVGKLAVALRSRAEDHESRRVGEQRFSRVRSPKG